MSESISSFSISDPSTFQSLPPVDRGKAAYLFLTGAAVVEVLVWGIPFASGVLHQYWTNVLFPEGTSGREFITISATVQSGLLYCLALPLSSLFQRYPHERIGLQAAGLVIAAAALFGLGFITRPWHLLIFNGLLYPFACMFYLPCATLIFEWFAQRRGFAGSILYAGTGVGGIVYPLVFDQLLKRFGYKATMISVAVAFLTIGLAVLPLLKNRLPLPNRGSLAHRQRRSVDRTFLTHWTTYGYAGVILMTSLGNFVPSIFHILQFQAVQKGITIPSIAFAQDLGLSSNQGTLLIALMNAASIPGLICFGYLSDKLSIRSLVLVNCLGSAISCFCCWGFATQINTLILFVISFGSLAMSLAALWNRMIVAINTRDDPNLSPLLFGIFAFLRGMGNIASGPISEALLGSNNFRGAKFGYGVENYGPLILYVSLTMCGAVVFSGLGASWRKAK